MITRQDCMSWILQQFPNFNPYWQEHLAYWDDEEAGLCNDMAVFSTYTEERIKNGVIEELPFIFTAVEKLMTDGDAEVREVVATCFLENLINRASAGSISAQSFVYLLGPASLAYCKAWDEFTGVRTEGLY